MANPEQVELLKQGVKNWNKWREENFHTNIDLSNANLSGANLSGVDLSFAKLDKADLRRTNLSDALLNEASLREANLIEANLTETLLNFANLNGTNLSGTFLLRANLSQANLVEANLSNAFLGGANLYATNLGEAILNGAELTEAKISKANLSGVDLIGADLRRAILDDVDLNMANLSLTNFGSTVLSNIDFSKTRGLEETHHFAPSTLGTNTILLFRGEIPEVFLRGCGLSDWEIETAKLYNPDLSNEEINKILYKMHDIRAQQSIQISPLFISYSHADTEFVNKLENYLNGIGVRFWRDVHDATAGRLEKQIDQAIRHNPTVLLIFSENSIKSDWVEHEVRTARELEKEINRDVLCPVALDESWKTSPWPKRIMEQVMEYNILDFSAWNDDSKFRNMFGRLIDGLNLYYKK